VELNLTKEQQLLLIGLVISIVIGLGVMAFRQAVPAAEEGVTIEQADPQKRSFLMVHVCGAVAKQGVFRVTSGSRLLDVLETAGGALPEADLSALNLAEAVKDGQKIVVPCRLPVSQAGPLDKTARININTATADEFDALPGIGKATAEKIVELRQKNGPFVRQEQIMEVPRLGKAKFEKIKDRLAL
jgi:competence protein ComEA